MSYNVALQKNNTDLQDILDAVNVLPEAGDGGDVELCRVTVDVPRENGFMVTSVWSDDNVTTQFKQFPIYADDTEFVCPKNTWVILYAPDNQGWFVDGGAEYYGETWDYQTIFFWVTGDGHIGLYSY